jgi:hypothetical protein
VPIYAHGGLTQADAQAAQQAGAAGLVLACEAAYRARTHGSSAMPAARPLELRA